MTDPRDKELKEAFDEIPDNIPDEDMPAEIPLPDDPQDQVQGDEPDMEEGWEEVTVEGHTMEVQEVGSSSAPGAGGGGSDMTNTLLERMLMKLGRLPDEIADSLKGG